MKNFIQKPPQLYNQFSDDDILQKYIKNLIPERMYNEIEGDLFQFGKKCGGEEYYKNSRDCEINPPKLDHYDAYGNEIFELKTTSGWKFFREETVNERLVSIPYTERYGKYNRLYQFIKLYMFSVTSGLFSCPLSMTDGAAYLIKIIKENNPDYYTDSMRETFNRIISLSPNFFHTSGQWMTEKKGGSDVRQGTETIAEKFENNLYKLNGLKWFTSSIDADVSFTLAKIKTESNNNLDKIAPTLFFVKLRKKDGSLNNIKPIRLKDKLGTKQVPTAELILDGTKAEIASPEANITRLHNIIASVSSMRRIIAIVEDYSYKRIAFGKIIRDQPLHLMTFSKLKFLTEGCLILILNLGKLQGIYEFDNSKSNQIELLRLLLPLAKLFTAKMSIYVCSEGMECIGGNGYMENSLIPNILRDSFVLSIWEGTTNVLSLDFLRVYELNREVINYFFTLVEKRITYLKPFDFVNDVLNLIKKIKQEFKIHISKTENSRPISFLITSIYIFSLFGKYYKKNKNIIEDNILIFWFYEMKKYYQEIDLTNQTKIENLKKTIFIEKPQYAKF